MSPSPENFDILGKLRNLSSTPREQGDLFERMVQHYLKTEPVHASRYSNVWQWGDWMRLQSMDATDIGIDLVAETIDGEYCAIQCKFFSESHSLQKADIDSFFTASGKCYNDINFSQRMIVSSTSRWSKHAENALNNQQIPCTRLGLDELLDGQIDWSAWLKSKTKAPAPKKQLRPHQKEALKNVIAGLKKADRGKMIMACGTGKTFTALKIAEKIAKPGGNVLFLVPSLSLLSQSLREWSQEASVPQRNFAVCSDSKVGKNEEDISVHDLAIPATTDAEQLATKLTRLSKAKTKRLNIIFSTYHSIDVIEKAQREWKAPVFDLIICDEAHRTTGIEQQQKKTSYFVRVHDNGFINARKRLYMTATSRIYTETAKQKAQEKNIGVFSMDEGDIYGEELYRLDFSTAVEKDLLSDYKVLILAVDESYVSHALQQQLAQGDELQLDDAAKIVGCWNGLAKRISNVEEDVSLDNQPMRRAVAFAGTIKYSKIITDNFSKIVNGYLEKNPQSQNVLRCETDHVDGTQNALERNKKLQWLKQSVAENECRILSNARCLSEGVDVPALDAVMFLSPRKSQVDIVQSVGRVMRKSEGKKYGYIILPIVVPSDTPPEQALDNHEKYKMVWQVLQALRAHDDRFNATINKIDLNEKRPDQIRVIGVGTGDEPSGTKEPPPKPYTPLLPFDVEEWRNAIYARLVLKCGDRRYWDSWAKDVADIARKNIVRIKTLVKSSKEDYRKLFSEFMLELRQNLNPAVSEDDAIEMLSQHLITRPVFNALFENYDFARQNPVSKTMQAMLELLDEQNLQTELQRLDKFYDSVRARASGIDNAKGKQRILMELYDKFFRTSFPLLAKALGIVYTPVEIVDFILQSVDDLLRSEFKRGLTDKEVHILDPFTGTGTFMSRLLQSDLIKDKDLKRKYDKELHANELVLLAYYIAAINIEEVFHDRASRNEYCPFEGIALTDTFQINERDGDMLDQIFPINSKRIQRQKKLPIRVIIGNPPYSAGQRSANDNNANLKYDRLDNSITQSYVKHSTVTNKNSLYDSYIRAIRWASDRIGIEGIVAYVSNGSYIDGNAAAGLRKCLTDEFSKIYVLNLRGNQRTSRDLSKREGGKIFGSGSRAAIAILFLVKNPSHKGKGRIFYHDIGDYLSREQKLQTVADFSSAPNIPWQKITPDKNYDWINRRNPVFSSWLPLGDITNKKKGKQPIASVFSQYSNGVKTNRDAWTYNFSRQTVTENMQKTINFYNNQVNTFQQAKSKDNSLKAEDFITYDSSQIHWEIDNKKDVEKYKHSQFNPECIRLSMYRPYCRQWLYFSSQWNSRQYLQTRIFPLPDTQNRAICVSGLGASKDFSALIVDTIPDLEIVSKSQCFPRHFFERTDKKNSDLFTGEKSSHQRIDNIPAATVQKFQQHYGNERIDGDAIFDYVYGILHSPVYKTRFASDLKKGLPHIPFASNFRAFSEAGARLAELHLNYETLEAYPLREVISNTSPNFQVKKMSFGGAVRTPDKSVILYNDHICLEGVPEKAYDYVVNGKSTIEWIMERYQYTTHKESKLTNDPNQWSDDPRYIIKLLKRVVTLSCKTVEIVNELPSIEE